MLDLLFRTGDATGLLTSTGARVDVAAASPPTAGQVLAAVDATHATWQTLAAAVDSTARAAAATAQSAANAAQATANAAVPAALFDANTVLTADVDNTPQAIVMAPSTTLARLATGNIKAASVLEMQTLLGVSGGGFTVAADINPFHWYRGDNTSQSGGLVDTIIDAGSSAKNFTQSGTPRCPTATDGNGKIYLAPDGLNDYYQAGVAADWKFLNDGSPFTICAVLQRAALISANEYLIDDTDGATASTGLFVLQSYASAAKQGWEAAMTYSSSANFQIVTNSFVPNTAIEVLIVRFKGANYAISASVVSVPVDMIMRRQGAIVSYGALPSSPSYANTSPSFTLTLFRRASTNGGFSACRLYDLIIHNACLSDRQVTGYENYARTQYGVAI